MKFVLNMLFLKLLKIPIFNCILISISYLIDSFTLSKNNIENYIETVAMDVNVNTVLISISVKNGVQGHLPGQF